MCKNDWTIYHANIRGFKSKESSLKHIIKVVDADVVSLNEHGLKSKQKLKMDGYKSYTKNRVDKAMGGVSISVKNDESPSVVKVAEGEDNNEFILTRHAHFQPAVNVLAVYGEQECRTSTSESDKRWEEMLEQIKKIEQRGESIVLIGDMNKAVGNDHLGVKDNHPKISRGGKYIREFLDNNNYTLVNNLPITVNGPFTRYDPGDPNNEEKKSCLDLVIISNDLLPFVEQLFIDREGIYAPSRSIGKKLRKPDHYPLILTFKNIPIREKSSSTK